MRHPRFGAGFTGYGLAACLCLALLSGVTACGDEVTPNPDVDEDRGLIDQTVSFEDRVNWPGVEVAGGRLIQFIRGFANGRPAGYWFLGFAQRETADSFWFCREGDELCPLDAHHRLNWDTLVGNPIFARLPGQSGFSPFWQMWTVTVPDDYVANSIKRIDSIHRLTEQGRASVVPFILDFGEEFGNYVGPQEVVLHCALVLSGTELAENGGTMPDQSGPMQPLELRMGWHEGFSVEFIDFSTSDGVFPEAEDSESLPLMPFANIYIQWRSCDADPRPPICDLPGFVNRDRRPVSERGLGQDLTSDGDPNDTNNVEGSLPCERTHPQELPYSPLWGVQAALVPPHSNLALMDTYADQLLSDVMSAEDMFAAVDAGLLMEPVPQTEDETGNPVPGNSGQVFFNCPNPVPVDYVPYPCSMNE